MSDTYQPRSTTWRWYICGLLFLATTINYLDRQTLATAAKRIQADFDLNNLQYGNLELGFGLAFATGGLMFGIIADKIGVYFLYPSVLLLWSTMGVLTGFVQNYEQLMLCRILLGFFEAGHWPCALKITQRLLARKDRGLGNSLLQGGTSVGAIIVPLLMNAMLTPEPFSWRGPFMVIGFVGMTWIFFWFASITRQDLAAAPPDDAPRAGVVADAPAGDPGGDKTFWQLIFTPRYLVLVVMVVAVNLCWHVFRVWLPKYLQYENGHGYSEEFALNFTSMYNVSAEVGCITSGIAMTLLSRRGLSVYRTRVMVFGFFALVTTMTTVAAMLPTGPLFLGSLLIVAFGALGLFPCYYSFAQEISHKHQGKVSGLLTVFAWVVPATIHPLIGDYIDKTKSYDLPIALSGWCPLVALLVILLLWNRSTAKSTEIGKVTEVKPQAAT